MKSVIKGQHDNIIYYFFCTVVLMLWLAVITARADTISNGLTLEVPDCGARNWCESFRDDFAAVISGHDHTGGGNGLQIGPSALSSNAVTGSSFRLANDQYLRARNFANSADLNVVKANASDKLIFDLTNVDATTRTSLGLGTLSTQAASAVAITGGTVTGITDLAVADGGTGASSAAAARSNLSAAVLGANGDITSLTAVTAINTALTSVVGSSASDLTIGIGTSNGTDNRALFLTSANSVTAGRGSHFDAYGYDHGSFPGVAAVTADGGELILYTTEADPIGLYTNTSKKWEVQSDGDFANDGTNGGNIVFSKTGTTVADEVATSLTAAGTVQGDALGLTHVVNDVTTTASGTGVRFTDASNWIGKTVWVVNYGANTLKLYPATGDEINQRGTNGATTIAAGLSNVCVALTTERWSCVGT